MERDEDEEREKETAREGWEGREKGREGKRDRKQYLELLEVVEYLHSVLGAAQGVLLQVPVKKDKGYIGRKRERCRQRAEGERERHGMGER